MFLFFVIYYILSCFCCWYIKKKRQRPSTPAFIYSPNDTDLLTNPNSLELDLATFNPVSIFLCIYPVNREVGEVCCLCMPKCEAKCMSPK